MAYPARNLCKLLYARISGALQACVSVPAWPPRRPRELGVQGGSLARYVKAAGAVWRFVWAWSGAASVVPARKGRGRRTWACPSPLWPDLRRPCCPVCRARRGVLGAPGSSVSNEDPLRCIEGGEQSPVSRAQSNRALRTVGPAPGASSASTASLKKIVDDQDFVKKDRRRSKMFHK